MKKTSARALALIAVTALSVLHPTNAVAQPRGWPRHSVVFIGGYFYDPFFGPYPWWGPAAYPYPYFPVYDDRAQVRLLVTPKEAAVYVDGYYAGIVGDFNGIFHSLPLSPGAHQLTLFIDGYRTVNQNLYLTRNKSYKVRYTMQPVTAGEQAEPPPSAPPVPPPPSGTAYLPHTPLAGVPPLPLPTTPSEATAAPPATIASGFGTLALRVQPSDAEVSIDGEKWTASQPGERLVVQVGEGRHHIEIQKSGYRPYSSDVVVNPGETATLNVSLSSL